MHLSKRPAETPGGSFLRNKQDLKKQVLPSPQKSECTATLWHIPEIAK